MADQILVRYGNGNPQMQTKSIRLNPDAPGGFEVITRFERVPYLDKTTTTISMRDEFNDSEHVDLSLSTRNDRVLALIGDSLSDEHRKYAVGVRELESIIGHHSAGVAPDWIWSNDPEFAKALMSYFDSPAVEQEPEMLIHNVGRDGVHSQMLAASQPPSYQYGAISTDTANPVATATTLTSEIDHSSSGGGLARKVMTFAHTNGTNTSTQTATWTVNSNDTGGPWVISKWANFTAATAGTIGWSDLLSTSASLSAVGDSATITFTLTA